MYIINGSSLFSAFEEEILEPDGGVAVLGHMKWRVRWLYVCEACIVYLGVLPWECQHQSI